VRFFDLILALAILALLLLIARKEFHRYQERTLIPSVPPAASASPGR